ncbi:MAG TPA: hypothetical protein VHU81_15520, partial [Thermoanaerobaculia bacterium]|nr:hypothetical protein [Thermoanaerobaculia bacterium]
METAAAAGTLLRVFAGEGDRLWLPAPVDPERIPEVEGLPLPIFETGPLERLPPAEEILAWGETPRIADLRTAKGASLRPDIAAAVNHRVFCLQVTESLHLALPGSRLVESLADLDRLLSTPTAPRTWVLKAPLSAAGRDRYIERSGPALTDPASRRAVAGLFKRAGSLLFEPWMDRTADYGCSVLLDPDGTFEVVSFHGQAVDRRGQF